MDTLQFHWYKFRWKKQVNYQYWNPAVSWENKYINSNPKDGFKYKTPWGFMANFLDAWHLFKMIMIISLALAVVCFPIGFKVCVFNNYWLNGVLWMAILGVAWNVPFNIFFNYIFVKK